MKRLVNQREMMRKVFRGFVALLMQDARHPRILGAVFFLAAFIVVFFLNRNGYLTTEKILTILEHYPLTAPFLFILIYALMVIFLIPTLPMNLGAGFLWGMWGGWPIALAGSTLGAVISFLVSRYLIHDYIVANFKSQTWVRIQKKIQENDWKIIAFVRANPIFPFGISSYFFGTTPVGFKRYLWSTLLPITPGVFIFCAIGDSIGGIVLQTEGNALLRAVLILSLAITAAVAVHVLVKRYARSFINSK